MAAIVIPFDSNNKPNEPMHIVLKDLCKTKNIELLEKICADCEIDARYCLLPIQYVCKLRTYIIANMNYTRDTEFDDVVIHYNKLLD